MSPIPKQRLRWQSIRSLLLLAFTLSLLIPLGAMYVYGHFFTSRILAEQAQDRSQYEVQLQAESFLHIFDSLYGDALYLASLRSFRQLRMSLAQGDSAALSTWQVQAEQDILIFASANPMYARLRYLDNTGQERLAIEAESSTIRLIPTADLVNRQSTSYFQQTLALEPNDIFVQPFVYDNETEKQPFIIRYSLRLGDGVLVLDAYASWLLRNLNPTGHGDLWGLIDSNGQHLLYPNSMTSTPMSRAIREADTVIKEQLERFLAEDSTSFQTRRSEFVFTRIYPTVNTASFWILYHEIPRSQLYASVDDFYIKSLSIITIAVLTSFSLAMAISGQIIQPLVDLQRKATNLARGITPPPPDHMPIFEIGHLTKTFHDMAQQLVSERQQKRRLMEKLITAQEEERKFIAYDLHDGLLQQLVGARWYLSSIPEDEQAPALKEGYDALSQAIIEGRRIIEGLHPTILDDLGLEAALKEMAQQVAKKAGWDLHLAIETLPERPDKTISVTIFRIVQEALNNIQKHAHAKKVWIHLSNHHHVNVLVEDDGKGFDPDKLNGNKGFGISTMRERAELIGGTCQIRSRQGQGTAIQIVLPYVADEPE